MKCWALRIICAGSLLAPSIAASAGVATHVQLKEEATVKGAATRLVDIVDIQADAAMRTRLAGVEIGPAPLPGYSRTVDVDYIRIRLRQQKLDPAILADTPRVCRVTRASQKLSGDLLVEEARKFLQGQIEAGEGRLAIEPVSRPREMTLPMGEVKLSPELSAGNPIGAFRRVTVRVNVDGSEVARADVSLRFRRYEKVAVACVQIARGGALSQDQIAYEERDRMSLPDDVMIEGQSLDGLVALQPIAKGTAITKRQAAEPAVVHRGDAVKVCARIGGINVSALAVASEDGRAGQLIRLRNADNNQELRAKVVDAKTVEVLL